MTIRRHDDPEAFLAAAEPLVAADVAHRAALRIWARPRELSDREPMFMATWERDGAAGVALQRGDGPVVIGNSAGDAATAFAAALMVERPGLAGVVGARAACDAFIAAWQQQGGKPARLRFRLRDHVLETLRMPATMRGFIRTAALSDRAWLLDMMLAFAREAGIPDAPATIERNLDGRLAARGFRILNDGEDVACAGFGVASEDVARIAPVYTRPAFRSRGYGSAIVASLCRELVDAGRRVFLVTDVANPTSSALYLRLGFVPLGESCHYDLIGPA